MDQRLFSCQQRIQTACTGAHRPTDSVQLLAVSKGRSIEQIRALYNSGQRDFGENYALEFSTKHELLQVDYKDICWHFMGQIQSNKIKQIARAHHVHSLSNLKHAELLAQHTPHSKLKVFVQVNLSNENTRGGIKPQEISKFIEALEKIGKLEIQGLMAILPINTPHPASHWFQQMQDLKLAKYPGLSMGMSSDFEEAIRFGATWVRIGSALF